MATLNERLILEPAFLVNKKSDAKADDKGSQDRCNPDLCGRLDR